MAWDLETYITNNIAKIAYRVGVDTNDTVAMDVLKDYVRGGVQQLTSSGVTDATLESNKLVLTTLIQYCIDSYNTPSDLSPITMMNVHQLVLSSKTLLVDE